MENPHIASIQIYPVKALDPISLDQVEMGTYSIKHDRAFALLAEDGRFVNGKRTGMVNQLKAGYDLQNQSISLSSRADGEKQTFELRENNPLLTEYLNDFFNMKVTLIHRTNGELMDIPKSSSITIVSNASIESLHQDLPDHSLKDLRLRFRANLEIGNVDPYWEEQLFQEPGTGVHFTAGDVEMIGVSPRARCNVPPRDPLTGETNKQFIKKMMESRATSLPEESKLPSHGGLYHLTVNTFLPENQTGKKLSIGDEVKILGPIKLS